MKKRSNENIVINQKENQENEKPININERADEARRSDDSCETN